MGKAVRTKSEMLFEQYLRDSRIVNFCFEKDVPGTAKKPDYSLIHCGMEILFEVKQFEPTPDDFQEGCRGYDPYAPIREKIDQARDKFQNLKQYCCCLVLYNADKPLVHLDWQTIYAAMLGDLGFRFPFVPSEGLIVEEAETAFLYNGKVRREKESRSSIVQNTTISAIIALDQYRVGEKKAKIELGGRELELGRKLTFEEHWDMISQFEGTEYDVALTELRAIVHENPYARIPIPVGIFCGPYDERYGHREGEIRRVFAGREIRILECDET